MTCEKRTSQFVLWQWNMYYYCYFYFSCNWPDDGLLQVRQAWSTKPKAGRCCRFQYRLDTFSNHL